MSSKKGSKNGFMKFCFSQQKNDSSLSGLSIDQLVTKCSPRWESLPASHKSHFQQNGYLIGSNRPVEGQKDFVGGIKDSYGRSMTALAKHKKEEELKKEKMKRDIKETVEMSICNNSLETKVFYLLSTSVFCITCEKQVVPAELSLAKINLAGGVIQIYHVFIEPGTIPKGYRSDCLANSKATHKIPLDFNQFEGDYNKIVQGILELLLSDVPLDEPCDIPPMFCMPKMMTQNKMVLDWLINKASSSMATVIEPDSFRLYSLPMLLFELSSQDTNRSLDTSFTSGSISLVRNRVPTVAIAEAQLERETFMFMPGMYCGWHQEQETIHCCKATVRGWAYTIFSLVNPLLGLPMMSESHMPLGQCEPGTSVSLGSYRSSVASCRMSITSGDTNSIKSGSFVEKPKTRRSYINNNNNTASNNNNTTSSRLSMLLKMRSASSSEFGDRVETTVETDQSFV